MRRSREQLEMEIDKFTIIERDNLTIACAALYPFPDEQIGEMACVAVHGLPQLGARRDVVTAHRVTGASAGAEKAVCVDYAQHSLVRGARLYAGGY